MKTVILFIIGAGLALKSECQVQYKIDSLLIELSSVSGSPEKAKILLEIIDLYSDENPAKAIQYAGTAMIEAENGDLDEIKADIFERIGTLYESMENLDLALENYRQALNIYRNLNLDRKSGNIYYQLGDVYKKKGFYKQSLENCLEGLKIFESLDDSEGLSNIYNCMGSLYKYQNDISRSLEYYYKSLDLHVEANDSSGTAMSYNNIGVVYSIIGNMDLALEYYLKSIEHTPSKGDEKNIATTLGNISSILLSQGKYDEAYSYINQSLEINNSLGYKRGTANQYRTLGRYYDLTGRPDLAIEYMSKAYQMHFGLGRLESLKEISEYLSDLYYRESRFEEAYEFSRLFKVYSDSIFSIEKMKNIAQLETNYLQMKEDEIHKLTDQKKKLSNTLTVTALLLISIIIGLFYIQQKTKLGRKNLELININLEKRQVEQELEMKQKELAASTIYRVRRVEMIEDVVKRLSEARKNLKEENVPIINNIIKDLCAGTEDDIWKEFEIRFLQVRKEFYENLQARFPELTTNEKRLSAFLSLDFSTKEIAAITKQSPHSINIARTRLRKKLGLANSDLALNSFLAQF
ncbi:MAG: tetratricopeptide repeat protein [Bacteroidales bacterium]